MGVETLGEAYMLGWRIHVRCAWGLAGAGSRVRRVLRRSEDMSSSTLRRNAMDVWEFARFIATGITATIGNIGAVWFVSRYASFEFSLLAGIAAGLLLS